MTTPSTILIVGGTRGLGAALAVAYAAAGAYVYPTARSAAPPAVPPHANITWIGGIDIAAESAGRALACAGFFESETFDACCGPAVGRAGARGCGEGTDRS